MAGVAGKIFPNKSLTFQRSRQLQFAQERTGLLAGRAHHPFPRFVKIVVEADQKVYDLDH
jgi:hypothetical protein